MIDWSFLQGRRACISCGAEIPESEEAMCLDHYAKMSDGTQQFVGTTVLHKECLEVERNNPEMIFLGEETVKNALEALKRGEN